MDDLIFGIKVGIAIGFDVASGFDSRSRG